mgnify:CR=1 FL=1
MTDLESLIVIDTAEPDNRIAVHPRLWNALVREVLAWRKYRDEHMELCDLAIVEKERAETDAAMKG